MKDSITKGILGVIAPATGYAVSLSGLEEWLKIISLLAGIAVSCAMFVSIGFTIRRKYRDWQESVKAVVRKHKSKHFVEEETTTL